MMTECRGWKIEQVSQAEQHHQQVQHNAEVADQIGQIHAKVDSQASTLQQQLDHKMEEQLAHIEKLLTRGRSDHENKKGRHK